MTDSNGGRGEYKGSLIWLHRCIDWIEKVDQVDPSYTHEGHEEYWQCPICGKRFSDGNAENEISEPVVIPMLERADISKATISPIKTQVYTGKAIKPKVTVKYNGRKLKPGRDYSVSYSRNKAIGSAAITIKGQNAYEGTVRKTFIINPKSVELVSLEADGKALKVKWNKGKKITGYEIQYSTKKKFKNAKAVMIPKAKINSTKITDLRKGKTYYIRIRAYKKTGNETYYSAWSKTFSKKVK